MTVLLSSHMTKLSLALCALCMLASCSSKITPPVAPVDTTKHVPTDSTTHTWADTTITATYALPLAHDTVDYYPPVKTGGITDPAIPELSGLAASRAFAGLLWGENDSGNPNSVFVIDSTGTRRATFTVTGASNRDWEDFAIGPGPTPGTNYLYLGEIGDNDALHSTSIVYRFPEPTWTPGATLYSGAIPNVEKIEFRYVDGPHNAESLLIDPLTKDIYIVSKNDIANVYYLPYPQRTDTIVTLKKIAVLPLNTLTAGDISADGSEILLKNYVEIYYWKRGPHESVRDALLRAPVTLPYIQEPKGEGMCFDPTGASFWTSGEVKNNMVPPIYRYWKKH